MRFFTIFLHLDDKFSLKLNAMIAYNNVKYLVEVKPTQNFFLEEGKFGPNGPRWCPKLVFFAIFSSLVRRFSFKLSCMIA